MTDKTENGETQTIHSNVGLPEGDEQVTEAGPETSQQPPISHEESASVEGMTSTMDKRHQQSRRRIFLLIFLVAVIGIFLLVFQSKRAKDEPDKLTVMNPPEPGESGQKRESTSPNDGLPLRQEHAADLPQKSEGQGEAAVGKAEQPTEASPKSEPSAPQASSGSMGKEASPKKGEVPKTPVETETRAGKKARTAKENYTVTVGSFHSEKNAEKYAAHLRNKGYEAFRIKVDLPKGKSYRVAVGHFADRKDAEILANRIKRQEKLSAFVTSLDQKTN